MKFVFLATLIATGTAYAQVKTYTKPAAGTYSCKAYRAYDSSAPTDIKYATVDDLKLKLGSDDSMEFITDNGTAVLSNKGNKPETRGYGLKLKYDLIKGRKTLNLNTKSVVDLAFAHLGNEVGLSDVVVLVEFRRDDGNRSHWNRYFRCK